MKNMKNKNLNPKRVQDVINAIIDISAAIPVR